MLSARYFSLSYKKKFVTKFVTCITKFVTRITKFVTCVRKFVTKNILADSKKLLADRENFQGERKKLLGDNRTGKEDSRARNMAYNNFGTDEARRTREAFELKASSQRGILIYKYVCPFLRRKYVIIFLHFRKQHLTL